MGREVRMVPPGWQHPRNEQGRYIPLHEGPWRKAAAEWDEKSARWDEGFVLDYSKCLSARAWKPKDTEYKSDTFAEYNGDRPEPTNYMVEFAEGTATHFQMYEDTSDGTPISPPMPDAESLARWLADNGASAFGSSTATYEQWLSMIKRGFAPSMVLDAGGLRSGVAALADIDPA